MEMQPKDIRMMRFDEVKKVTGLSAYSINKAMEEGNFPPAYRLSVRIRAWKSNEIYGWMASRGKA